MTGQINVNKIAARTGTAITVESGHVITQPGSVIQFVQHKWNTHTATTSESYVDVTSSSFNFTPKLATSKLYIQANCAITVTRSSSAGYGVFKIVHDGTDIDAPSDRYEIGMGVGGGSTTGYYVRAPKSGYVDAGNTNARAIKLQTAVNANSNSGTLNFNVNGLFYSYIDVMEIAQ